MTDWRRVAAPAMAGLSAWLLAQSVASASGQGPDRSSSYEQSERILVVGEPSHPVSRLLKAELTADGWTVTVLAAASLTNVELEAQYGAVAILRSDPETREVEIWVAGQGRRTAHSEVILGDKEKETVSVLPMRAAEVLRAHLLTPGQLQLLPRKTEPAPGAAQSEPSSESTLMLQFVPAAALGAGGLGLRPDLLLGLEFRHTVWLSTAVGATVPISPSRIEGPEGSADVRPYVFHASVALTQTLGEFRVGAAAGGALAQVRMVGQQVGPSFEAATATTTSGGPIVRVFARYELALRISIRSELLVGAMLNRSVVAFDGRRVASWGQPFGALGLGLELGL